MSKPLSAETITPASRHAQLGFRVTGLTWPQAKLPLPPRQHETYQLVGAALIPAAVGDMEGRRLDPREALGETYLHLERLDLEDEQAVVDFVDRHGVLGVRFGTPEAPYEMLGPWLRADRRIRPRLEASVRRAQRDEDEWLGISAQRRQRYTEKSGEGSLLWGPGKSGEGLTIAPAKESITEFRFGAACIKECIALWAGLQADGYDEPAARRLETTFRGALRVFTPNVAFVQGRVRDEQAAAVVTRFWSQVPLFAVCLLELFNHIAEGAEYRTCKECSRRFVRQEGRAKYGQHRIRGGAAAVFCSTAHASTFTTRAARERAREKKTTSGAKKK